MQNRTRIKICGVTREQDALHAAARGVDSIGLVMHPLSPRALSIKQAIRLRNVLPPFVTATVLFMDECEDWIAEVVEQVKPDCLQFHGCEPLNICEAWRLPFIKSVPMGSVDNVAVFASEYGSAQGLLLDSNAAGRQGGSGDTFDWSKIPHSLGLPLLLAGGINPFNVAEAINMIKPWAVDVSSGVEVDKGVKSDALVDQLVREVINADKEINND